jgi:hypothetical protein
VDKAPTITIAVRHFILTSYDNNRHESEKTNSPEEVKRRQQIFDEYGKEKPK